MTGGGRPRFCTGIAISTAILIFAVPVAAAPPGSTDRARSSRGPGMWNHPVGVVPSSAITIPPDWPLGPGGTIVCTTCHEGEPGTSPEHRVRNPRIQDDGPARFCSACHTSPDAERTRAAHWRSVDRAHVRPDVDDGAGWNGSIDAESRRCLGCHDGVSAADAIGNGRARTVGFLNGRPNGDHPIGGDYRHAAHRRPDSALRPIQLLPPGIRLPGGRVSCVSCHDLYAGTPILLTVPIEESRLCFACHKMD